MDLKSKGEFNMVVKYTKGNLTEILQKAKELGRAFNVRKIKQGSTIKRIWQL